jgi:hypothetical protein
MSERDEIKLRTQRWTPAFPNPIPAVEEARLKVSLRVHYVLLTASVHEPLRLHEGHGGSWGGT